MTNAVLRRLGAGLAALALALAAAPACAAELPKLTLSYSEKTVDMMPLWIAEDAGYFKAKGVDVTERYLPAQEGVPALLTNEVQIAAIGGSDALSAVAQGAKLKFVLTLSPVYTFQFWARPQFATASALKGQRVGVPSTTGSLFAATVLALKELGLTTSDVAITPLGSVPNVNSSLLAGSIAAACSHAPATYQFEKAGFKDVVDLARKRIPSISAGLLVPDSYLAAHADAVQRVVDAVMEGIERERTDRAYVEGLIAKHLGVKGKPILDFTYDFYVKDVLGPGPMPKVEQVVENQNALAQANPKVKSVDAASMVDPHFVKAAMK